MKLLLILLACTSPALADQAAESFATGFANGFSQARYGQQNTQNVQQVNVTTRQMPQEYHQQAHYDARDNYGNLSGNIFATYGQCRRYAANSNGRLIDCDWVQ